MRRTGTLLALAGALLVTGCAWADSLSKEPNHVYVCSFNVYKLGAVAPKYRSAEEEVEGDPPHIPDRIRNLANVLAVGKFDLIVLQEVKAGNDGECAVADLVSALRDDHNLEYKCFVSDEIGQGLVPEAIAFIYDETVVKPEVITSDTSLVRNIEIPGRDLVRTQWVAGDFDFTLVACHLAWGNESDRDAGYQKIETILATPVPSDYSHDPDIVVLGDFNRFGKGYDSVKELDYDPAVFRAPNVVFFDSGFNAVKAVSKARIKGKGVPNDDPQLLSTTVATNKMVYDMILFTADAGEEFPQSLGHAVYGTDFGILHFDESGGFGYQTGADALSHNDLKEAYSDHRPLWIRFKTNASRADRAGAGPGTSEYVGTPGGEVFHAATCRYVRGKTNLVRWVVREDAIAAERRACRVCGP